MLDGLIISFLGLPNLLLVLSFVVDLDDANLIGKFDGFSDLDGQLLLKILNLGLKVVLKLFDVRQQLLIFLILVFGDGFKLIGQLLQLIEALLHLNLFGMVVVLAFVVLVPRLLNQLFKVGKLCPQRLILIFELIDFQFIFVNLILHFRGIYSILFL